MRKHVNIIEHLRNKTATTIGHRQVVFNYTTMNRSTGKMAKPLGKALAISLALHAFLLLQENRPVKTTPATDMARAHDGDAKPLAARLRATRLQEAASRVPPAQIVTPAASAGQAAAATTATAPLPENVQRTPRSPPSETTDTTDTASATIEAAANGNMNAHANPPVSILGDGNGLRQYRIDLAVAARRFRNYPTAARSAGLGGVAGIRVAVDANGQSQGTELHSSSGNALLDAAALAMLENAARTTAAPPTLRGQPFDVLIHVEFDPQTE